MGSEMCIRDRILNTTACTNLRQIANLYKVNEAGRADLLDQGVIDRLYGFGIRESAQVQSHTKGTGSSYLADLVAGFSVGDTSLHVDTGTGTILQGDVVTFAGDTNKYVIGTGFAGNGDGDIVLNPTGLRAALANNAAMTIGNNYTANIAMHRAAMELAIRVTAFWDCWSADSKLHSRTVHSDVSCVVVADRHSRVVRKCRT